MDSVKGINEVKFYCSDEERRSEINKRSKELEEVKAKNNNISTLFKSISEAIIVISGIVFVGISYYLYTKNLLDIYQIIIGVTLLLSSYGPLLALSALPSTLVDTFASGNRILDLLDQKPSLNKVTNALDINSFESLEISNLNYSYDKNNNVLNDANLNIKKNEIIAIK